MNQKTLLWLGSSAGALLAVWAVFSQVAAPASEKYIDGRIDMAQATVVKKIEDLEQKAVEADKDLAVIKEQTSGTERQLDNLEDKIDLLLRAQINNGQPPQ